MIGGMSADTLGTLIGGLLTVAVLSYIIGDNLFYRLAIAVFVGGAAAFLVIAGAESVIVPWLRETVLVQPLDPGRAAIGLTPFVLALLLVLRSTRRLGGLGGVGLSFVIGVGTAVALLGAVNGTLLPLLVGSSTGANQAERIISAAITGLVLLSFSYLRRRRAASRPDGEPRAILPTRLVRGLGQGVLIFSLGAGYALLILSALTALTGVIATRLIPLTR